MSTVGRKRLGSGSGLIQAHLRIALSLEPLRRHRRRKALFLGCRNSRRVVRMIAHGAVVPRIFLITYEAHVG